MQMEGFEHLLCTQTSRFLGSQTLVLTPPTRCYYECGKKLVSNHRTQVYIILYIQFVFNPLTGEFIIKARVHVFKKS